MDCRPGSLVYRARATGGLSSINSSISSYSEEIVASACEWVVVKIQVTKGEKAPRRKDGPLLRLDALISVFTNTFIHLVVVFILAPLIHSKTV
jgi:hypothetical protein